MNPAVHRRIDKRLAESTRHVATILLFLAVLASLVPAGTGQAATKERRMAGQRPPREKECGAIRVSGESVRVDIAEGSIRQPATVEPLVA